MFHNPPFCGKKTGGPADGEDRIIEQSNSKQTGLGLYLCREIFAFSWIITTGTGTDGKGSGVVICIPEQVCPVSGMW